MSTCLKKINNYIFNNLIIFKKWIGNKLISYVSNIYYQENPEILYKISQNTLIIFPHYKCKEIIDSLICEDIRRKSILKSLPTCIILANGWLNKLAFYIFKEEMLNFIFIKKDTVGTVCKKIKENNIVGILIFKNTQNKGIYYIVKETKCPVLIVKRDINPKKSNCKYKINYINYEYEIDNKTPEEFINGIKNIMFH